MKIEIACYKLTGKWYTGGSELLDVEPGQSLRNAFRARPDLWPVKSLSEFITVLTPEGDERVPEVLPPDCIGDLEKVLKDTASQLNVEADNEQILFAIDDLQSRYAARVQADTDLGDTLAPMVQAGQLPKDMRQAVQTLVDFQKLAFGWFTQKGVYPVEMPNGQVLWGWDGMEVFLAEPCASPFDAVVQKIEYGVRENTSDLWAEKVRALAAAGDSLVHADNSGEADDAVDRFEAAKGMEPACSYPHYQEKPQ